MNKPSLPVCRENGVVTAGDTPVPTPSRRGVARNAEFDVDLGARIRRIRIAAELSQSALGAALGVSFQQIQKYEKGQDRIAVGTLNAMALLMGVDVAAFFSSDPALAPRPQTEMLEAQRLGTRVLAIGDPALIRRVMALVDTLTRSVNNGD